MIRIKVYKASHLIVGFLVFLIVIALGVFVLTAVLSNDVPASSRRGVSVSADAGVDGEVVAAFAAAPFLPVEQVDGEEKIVKEVVFEDLQDDAAHPSDEALWENEHTDSVDTEFFVEVVPSEPDAEPSPIQEGKPIRILIYHTHTHEAYQQTPEDPYEETEQWRTVDEAHSVVRVGAELTKDLEARGYEVVHDTTDHEPPKLGTAYTRSLQTLERLNADDFDICIDLHRDAYGESIHKGVIAVSSGTTKMAQLMILLGNGEGFNAKPDFQKNYQLAKTISDRLDAIMPNLSRGVLVKNGRYNQHVGKRSILVEVGHNRNTLKEALASVPYLAEALDGVLQGG